MPSEPLTLVWVGPAVDDRGVVDRAAMAAGVAISVSEWPSWAATGDPPDPALVWGRIDPTAGGPPEGLAALARRAPVGVWVDASSGAFPTWLLEIGAQEISWSPPSPMAEQVLTRALRRAAAEAERSRLERVARVESARAQGIFHTAAIGLLDLDLSGLRPLYEVAAAAGPSVRASEFLAANPAIVEAIASAVVIRDANDEAARLFEVACAEDLRGPFLRWFRGSSADGVLRLVADLFGEKDAGPREVQMATSRGHVRRWLVASRLPESPDGWGHVVASLVDVTELRTLQEASERGARMEALGRLAGGISHDFNNVLNIILNYAQFAMEDLAPDDPRHADISAVVAAARQGAGLTAQLLAFSREQPTVPQVLDLSGPLTRMHQMLARLLGRQVIFSLAIEPIPPVRIDPTQLDQIVLNLVLNARDAMPEGGTLKLTARRVSTRPADPGRTFVCVEVADSGHGMEPSVALRIFEPFFTTKGPGKGTGLGLSTVYGLVHKAGGQVDVVSTPGQGSTFAVYLPAVDAPISADAPQAVAPEVEAMARSALGAGG